MSLVRYPPWGLVRSLQDDLDRLFEHRIAADDTSGSVDVN